MSIITLQEYKDYSGITNTSQDGKLQPLVDYVNAFIEGYCGSSFTEQAVLGRMDTAVSSSILLPEYPIISVEEIRYVTRGVVSYTVPSTDFVLDDRSGIITLTGLQPTNVPYNVSIDFTHGYQTAPVPLKVSAFELITYFNKREFNQSRSGGSNGDTSVFIDPKVLPIHIRAALDLYRVI